MFWKLIELAALLAVGFMIFRPMFRSRGHEHHGSDPETGTQSGNSTTTHNKKGGGGCCG